MGVDVSAGLGVDDGVRVWVIVPEAVGVRLGPSVGVDAVRVAVALGPVVTLVGGVVAEVRVGELGVAGVRVGELWLGAVAVGDVGVAGVAVAVPTTVTTLPVAVEATICVGVADGRAEPADVADADGVADAPGTLGETDGAGLGDAPAQPESALLTAPTSSKSWTLPSPFVSTARQVSTLTSPSAIWTPRMSSLTATCPSSLQSPRQPLMPLPAFAGLPPIAIISAAALTIRRGVFLQFTTGHRRLVDRCCFGAIVITRPPERWRK